ncbi:hypothetical protein SBA2_270013 [Acidobacteriia bacterium SbA2]|nr:hypothetical protein SBA2_270013 [Acidobacteriia bacterium SbA2]
MRHSGWSWASGPVKGMKITRDVTPAKAGVHCCFGTQWIPACAGMTGFSRGRDGSCHSERSEESRPEWFLQRPERDSSLRSE